MSRPHFLIVLSSADQGWYLPEFAHPYDVLSPYIDITVASPKGGKTICDPVSVDLFKDDEVCMNFYKTKRNLWETTLKLDSFLGQAGSFTAIFYVGGFGPMFDLVDNQASLALIREFHEKDKMVVFLCHGTAAALNVILKDGTRLIDGVRVTGFSNQEEIDVDRQKDMPFHLQDALDVKSGGHYEKAAKAWDPHVTVTKEKKLFFGQNPNSAHPLAIECLKYLSLDEA